MTHRKLHLMALFVLMWLLALAAWAPVAVAQAAADTQASPPVYAPLRHGDDDDDRDDDNDDRDNDDDDRDDDDDDRDDSDDDRPAIDGPEIKGIITQMPTALVGEWVIGGMTLVADSQTWFHPQRNRFALGVCVEAELRAGGNVIATLKTDDDCPGGAGGGAASGVREFKGIINQLPAGNIGTWVVGGNRYTVDAGTRIDPQRNRFAPGVCVEMEVRVADGYVLSVKTDDDCGRIGGGATGTLREVRGTIAQRPAGLLGQWVIGGVTVTADARTWFSQRHAPLTAGGCVELKYRADGTAVKIEARRTSDCNGSLRADHVTGAQPF